MFSFTWCNYHYYFRYLITLIFLSNVVSQFKFVQADVVIISPFNRTTEIFDNAELAFGSVPLEGISGKIVLSEPEDACSEIKSAPNNDETWFLLAKRYPCPFETKVRNAATAGFKAVIIYSVDPSLNRNKQKLISQQLQQLQKTSTQTITDAAKKQPQKVQYNLDIPSILISYLDGDSIKQNYLHDKGYTAVILPRIPFPLNAYLLPFAIVIVVCLFLMVSFLIFQVIKCARDRRKIQRHRLSTRQLRQLLTTIYSKGRHYDTCAICLDDYVEGDKLRVLPCSHEYHIRCIDPWLTKSRRICPVCKGKVRVTGMSDVSDTESESEQSRQVNYNNANESTPLLRPTTTSNNNNNQSTTSTATTMRPSTATTTRSQGSEISIISRPTTINGSINGSLSDHVA